MAMQIGSGWSFGPGWYVGAAATPPPALLSWSTPATMGGTTLNYFMYAVAVNTAGLFVAVGNNNTSAPLFATSANGTTWTIPAAMNGSATAAQMRAVTVNSSGLFVAVGYGSTTAPRFATSANGSTWTTPAAMNGSTASAIMTSITWSSTLNLFVAVGYNNTTAVPLYATSTNGSTWTTPAAMNGSAVGAQMTSITWSSTLGLFVAVGYDSANTYPVYATSSNGSTWTTPALMNGSTVLAQMKAVAVNSAGLFVAVGNDSNAVSVYATSSNGSTWTTPTFMNSYSGPNICDSTAIAVSPTTGQFIAVGPSFSGQSPFYSNSSNGSNWNTPTSIISADSMNLSGVAVNSAGLIVAVGWFNLTFQGPAFTYASS